jgi:hypothetical protein
MYERLSTWLDEVFSRTAPEGIVSVCFNLYEDGDDSWSMEVVGCSSFDSNDPDWACDEVTDFGTRDEPFEWTDDSIWEKRFSLISPSFSISILKREVRPDILIHWTASQSDLLTAT